MVLCLSHINLRVSFVNYICQEFPILNMENVLLNTIESHVIPGIIPKRAVGNFVNFIENGRSFHCPHKPAILQ